MWVVTDMDWGFLGKKDGRVYWFPNWPEPSRGEHMVLSLSLVSKFLLKPTQEIRVEHVTFSGIKKIHLL